MLPSGNLCCLVGGSPYQSWRKRAYIFLRGYWGTLSPDILNPMSVLGMTGFMGFLQEFWGLDVFLRFLRLEGFGIWGIQQSHGAFQHTPQVLKTIVVRCPYSGARDGMRSRTESQQPMWFSEAAPANTSQVALDALATGHELRIQRAVSETASWHCCKACFPSITACCQLAS